MPEIARKNQVWIWDNLGWITMQFDHIPYHYLSNLGVEKFYPNAKKWPCFDKRSTNTKITIFSPEGGKLVMKSIEIECQIYPGIGNGYNSLLWSYEDWFNWLAEGALRDKMSHCPA